MKSVSRLTTASHDSLSRSANQDRQISTWTILPAGLAIASNSRLTGITFTLDAVADAFGKEPDPGSPDARHISTSHVERQNLNMRTDWAPPHSVDECLLKQDRQPRPRGFHW
jgi:hypothetical protein